MNGFSVRIFLIFWGTTTANSIRLVPAYQTNLLGLLLHAERALRLRVQPYRRWPMRNRKYRRIRFSTHSAGIATTAE